MLMWGYHVVFIEGIHMYTLRFGYTIHMCSDLVVLCSQNSKKSSIIHLDLIEV
jgi:hypothetical protein